MKEILSRHPTGGETLGQILQPIDLETFLRKFWGKQFCHIQGRAGKFSHLFSWDDLNSILEQHRLEPPRIRLTLDGKIIPPESFIEYTSSPGTLGIKIPRFLSAEMTKLLRNGATLVIDSVESLHPKLRKLAEQLETFFASRRVKISLFASWGKTEGFTHWDPHDFFALQVFGQKDWKIFSPTRKHPLADDKLYIKKYKNLLSKNSKTEMPQNYIWRETLQEGDLIYVPRGWWHSVAALGVPTLHLTCEVALPSGSDLLEWSVDKLRQFTTARMDLPRLLSPENQAKFTENLKKDVFSIFDEKLIDDFISSYDAKTPFRPHFSFPWGANQEIIPADYENFSIKLLTSAPLTIFYTNDKNKIQIKVNKKQFSFSASALPILEKLSPNSELSLTELEKELANVYSKEIFSKLIKEFVNIGLVAICPK